MKIGSATEHHSGGRGCSAHVETVYITFYRNGNWVTCQQLNIILVAEGADLETVFKKKLFRNRNWASD